MLPLDKKKLFSKNSIIEHKFIVIKRKDNIFLENTNPFIIKNPIDYICGGEVEKCKVTRAGTILILAELKSQKVSEAYKWTKQVDQYRVPTGFTPLTFNFINHPENVFIGYEIYIPGPMPCKKLLRFKHPQPGCKQDNPTCKNCSETIHNNDNKECKQQPK